MNSVRCLFFLSLFVCTASLAQQNQCLALFDEITKKAAESRKTYESKGFSMKCGITITQSDNNVFQDHMSVRQSKGKYYYDSKNATIYMDKAAMVVIQHEEKNIFITKANPLSERKEQVSQILSVMDSLRKYITVQSCSKEYGTVARNEGYQKLVFKPNDVLRDAGISQITYWIHEPSKSVGKVELLYTGDNDYNIKKYELVLSDLNYDYAGAVFDGDAVAKIFNRQKQLDSRYKGYSLTDNR